MKNSTKLILLLGIIAILFYILLKKRQQEAQSKANQPPIEAMPTIDAIAQSLGMAMPGVPYFNINKG